MVVLEPIFAGLSSWRCGGGKKPGIRMTSNFERCCALQSNPLELCPLRKSTPNQKSEFNPVDGVKGAPGECIRPAKVLQTALIGLSARR
jgi:hypothetical protein